MGRPEKELTDLEKERIQAAWDASDGKISVAAKKLGVTWQTARRWLKQIGLLEEMNTRLDRPGLVWPHFEVKLDKHSSVIVEAPNWAIACKMTGLIPLGVQSTGLPITVGYAREDVKRKCPGYMDRTLSVADLMQEYVDQGVIVRM